MNTEHRSQRTVAVKFSPFGGCGDGWNLRALASIFRTTQCSYCGEIEGPNRMMVGPKGLRKVRRKLPTVKEPVCCGCFNRIKQGAVKAEECSHHTARTALKKVLRMMNEDHAAVWENRIQIEEVINSARVLVQALDNESEALLLKLKELTEAKKKLMNYVLVAEPLFARVSSLSYDSRRAEANRIISDRRTREIVFGRDNNRCVWCGSQDALAIDHIIAVKNHGSNELSNLQTLCTPCNSRKGCK